MMHQCDYAKWTLILIALFATARVLVEVSTWVSAHYDYHFSGVERFLILFVNYSSYILGVALIIVPSVGLVVEINNYIEQTQEIEGTKKEK